MSLKCKWNPVYFVRHGIWLVSGERESLHKTLTVRSSDDSPHHPLYLANTLNSAHNWFVFLTWQFWSTVLGIGYTIILYTIYTIYSTILYSLYSIQIFLMVGSESLQVTANVTKFEDPIKKSGGWMFSRDLSLFSLLKSIRIW